MMQAINHIRTVCFLSLQTGLNRAQPIFVRLFFIRYQVNPCRTMEVNHRANYRADFAKHMNESSLWKKLSQAADVQRIFRRSINPASLWPGCHARRFEPSWVSL